MLITNSLASRAKLVRSAQSCNKEHSEWFVLQTSALFKGLGEEGEKAEFGKLPGYSPQNPVIQVATSNSGVNEVFISGDLN